jgi:hypothetical protein
MGYHESDLRYISKERDIDAVVFAMLKNDTICIVLHPGSGLANGGIHIEVPLSLIRKDLRVPNTRLIATVQNGNVTRIGPANPT